MTFLRIPALALRHPDVHDVRIGGLLGSLAAPSPTDEIQRFEISMLDNQRHQLIMLGPGADPSFQRSVHPVALHRPFQKDFRPIGFAADSAAPGAKPERTV